MSSLPSMISVFTICNGCNIVIISSHAEVRVGKACLAKSWLLCESNREQVHNIEIFPRTRNKRIFTTLEAKHTVLKNIRITLSRNHASTIFCMIA